MVLAVALAVRAGAQSPATQARVGSTPSHAAAAVAGVAAPQPPMQTAKPQAPPTALPPEPAAVVLQNGKLQVSAQNADLPQILSRIAQLSGMTIEGSVAPSRVFGVFGPGDPRAVLNELLEGSGYNYMLVGVTPLGTPKMLRIALKNGSATSPVIDARAPAREPEEPGPGAITNVPPPPAPTAEERSRRNLQRLQQMHDSEKRQSPPQ